MINTRHAYDKKLEEIIEHNEYLFNPYEQPFKPSYLDYNWKNMIPVFPERLNGFERVLAEYHKNDRKKITSLNEEDCMNLLKFIFPDIYKIKTDEITDYDSIDYHVPSHNLYIDHKERERYFHQEDGGMTLDKPKYLELMKEDNGYILNSTDIGLFIWNVKLLGDVEWIYQENTPVSTRFERGKGRTEPCEITYLPYDKCNDLTYLLLQYT
jgi:hypothetical protein